jgi:transposase-like protein
LDQNRHDPPYGAKARLSILRQLLSYRELAELARELGVSVAPSTVLRWVVRYVPEFEKCWQAYERPVGDSCAWTRPTSK